MKRRVAILVAAVVLVWTMLGAVVVQNHHHDCDGFMCLCLDASHHGHGDNADECPTEHSTDCEHHSHGTADDDEDCSLHLDEFTVDAAGHHLHSLPAQVVLPLVDIAPIIGVQSDGSVCAGFCARCIVQSPRDKVYSRQGLRAPPSC